MDDTEAPLAHQRAVLRSAMAGQRVVVVAPVLVAAVHRAEGLRDLGVRDALVVAGTRGTGEVDAEIERDAIVLGTAGHGVMGGIRAFDEALDDPPASLVAAVEAFDPARTARVLVEPFQQRQHLFGRAVLGGREPAWCALEDKTIVDALWDAAGVLRAPAAVIDLDDTEGLRATVRGLDRGHGAVLVADNASGWHGGAHGLRWVRDDTRLEHVRTALLEEAVRVRVMPFLDGVPCSIHGWVVGPRVLAFRPCEMVVLRERDADRLWYAGGSTTWLPRDDDRDAMRGIALRVGAHLRDEYGYRGVFTVDGVLTEEGFRPTELNPRYGAALEAMARGASLPLYLLHVGTVEWPGLDWRAADLEHDVLVESLRAPRAGAGLVVDQPVQGQHRLALRTSKGGYVPASEDEEPAAVVELGPAAAGSFAMVTLHDTPLGPRAAPGVARALGVAAEVFGLDLPPLEPAPDLRPASPTVAAVGDGPAEGRGPA